MIERGNETFEHTADMGLRGWGPDAGAAICEAACAMFKLISGSCEIEPELEMPLEITGSSLDEILVELLNELLSASDLEDVAFTRLTVLSMEHGLGEWILNVSAAGVSRSSNPQLQRTEVKAATGYGAVVAREKTGRWVAECVVDL